MAATKKSSTKSKKNVGLQFFGQSHLGLGRYCEELVKHLAAAQDADLEIKLVVEANADHQRAIRLVNDIGCEIEIVYYPKKLKKPFLSLSRHGICCGMMPIPGIDLFHITNHKTLPMMKKRNVFTHHHYPRSSKGSPEKFCRRAHSHIKCNVQLCDKIIAVSKSSALELCEIFPGIEEKVEAIYHGICSSFFQHHSNIPLADIKRACGIPQGKRYFINAGSWALTKNIPLLVDAWVRYRSLSNVGNDHMLVMVGGSRGESVRDEIERRLRGTHYASDFIDLGFVDEEAYKALLRSAEALVFLSKEEGFGLPLLEAMASGVPVVASDIPVFREIVGSNIPLTSIESEEACARALLDIVENPQVRKRLVDAGKNRASEFTWERTAQKTISVYRKVLRMDGE